jgi:hypothetical protein
MFPYDYIRNDTGVALVLAREMARVTIAVNM